MSPQPKCGAPAPFLIHRELMETGYFVLIAVPRGNTFATRVRSHLDPKIAILGEADREKIRVGIATVRRLHIALLKMRFWGQSAQEAGLEVNHGT